MAQRRLVAVADQKAALLEIAKLMQSGADNPDVIQAAKVITRQCNSRDDACELEAIIGAVKHGHSRVPWLKDGMRYVADPRGYDTFSAVSAQIESCADGGCAFDCDDSTIMVGALCTALGFKAGVRAWGPARSQDADYGHVYCVVAVPKGGPWPRDYYGHGMDVSVDDPQVGWEPGEGSEGSGPGRGHFMTAWLPDDGE